MKAISWLILFAIFSDLSAAEAPAAQENSASTELPDETLVLPKLEVLGSFDSKGWVYGHAENTEFLSQRRLKETRDLATQFAVFRDFVRKYYPQAALPADALVTIVLFKTNNYTGQLVKASASGKSRRFILVDDSGDDPQLEMEREIRRRWLKSGFLFHTDRNVPLWLEWATIEVLVAIEITGSTSLKIGYPPYNPHMLGGKFVIPRGAGGPSPHVVSLQFALEYGQQVSLREVFTVSREAAPRGKARAFCSATSTAFIHMCLFGAQHRKFHAPFQNFTKRLTSEPFSDQLFQECFGLKVSEMDWILRDYLFSPSLKYETSSYKASANPAFELVDAKPAVVIQLLNEVRAALEAK